MRVVLCRYLVGFGVVVLLCGTGVINGLCVESISCSPLVSSGTWLYVGGSGPGNYTTIQSAINAANCGDTVYVYNGTYDENIIIDRPIQLIGENRSTTSIDGNIQGDTVTIGSEKVTVKNFTIINGKTDFKLDIFRAGIRVTASHCVIKENIIRENQLGIFGLRVTNLTIVHNSFYGNGITFSPYENLGRPKIYLSYFIHDVSENMVNEKPLLYLLNQKDLQVTEPAGQIIAVNCSDITFRGLGLTELSTDSAILMAYCSNCVIEKSNISHNLGIWTLKSDNNIFRNNTFSDNFHGITLDYCSNNNNIESNHISNNQLAGVMIEYYSKNNLISKNNFIENEYNGFFTQALKNRWHGNYYDDWRGLDHRVFAFLPKIIFGRVLDVDFYIPWINLDMKPVDTPYAIDTNS
jgi:nitrous oxidase accessory protein